MSGTMRYEQVTWRDGSNAALSSRFACLRIRAAHRMHVSKNLRAEEWLLVEWPDGDAEPARDWFSTAPVDATLEQLVYVAKMGWRIERDYEDLKQEFGLSHYEGRGWIGFTLCIAAYAFLMYRRLRHHDVKKTALDQKRLPYPRIMSLADSRHAQRHVPDSIRTPRGIAQTLLRCPCVTFSTVWRNASTMITLFIPAQASNGLPDGHIRARQRRPSMRPVSVAFRNIGTCTE